MAKRPLKKKPPYRVALRPANLLPAEAEIRLNRVFDILIGEVGRLRNENKKRRQKKAA